MRERYGNLLDSSPKLEHLQTKEIKVRSTQSQRTIASCKAFLNGLMKSLQVNEEQESEELPIKVIPKV